MLNFFLQVPNSINSNLHILFHILETHLLIFSCEGISHHILYCALEFDISKKIIKFILLNLLNCLKVSMRQQKSCPLLVML